MSDESRRYWTIKDPLIPIDQKVIQSNVRHVGGQEYFVSTIYRQSSVAVAFHPWFYETLVWKWNIEKREREELVCQSTGLNNHYEICKRILDTGNPEEGE